MRKNIITEYIAAKMSSIIIPKPPSYFFSNTLIGQGFNISKNLKIIRANRYNKKSKGTNIRTNH